MKTVIYLLLVCVLFSSCALTIQQYSYTTYDMNQEGKKCVREKIRGSAMHSNLFSDKKVGTIISKIGKANASVEATKYTSNINEEAIESTGTATGKIVGAAARTAVIGA
jgi:nucleoside phosphorylase